MMLRRLTSEAIGSFLLFATVVGSGIMAGYWFTSSTSFANPAITLGRALTNSFSGIASSNVTGFIIAQIVGALLAWKMSEWLFSDTENR